MAQRLSGVEGGGSAGQEVAPGHGGASGPAIRRGDVVRQVPHSEWQKTEERLAQWLIRERTIAGGGAGGVDKMHGHRVLL
jgi:hypothetical protein